MRSSTIGPRALHSPSRILVLPRSRSLFLVLLSFSRILGFSDSRPPILSSSRILRFSASRPLALSNSRPLGFSSSCRSLEFSFSRILVLSNSRPLGFSSSRPLEFSSSPFSRILAFSHSRILAFSEGGSRCCKGATLRTRTTTNKQTPTLVNNARIMST